MSGIKDTILKQQELLDILKDLITKIESGEVSIESYKMYTSTDVSRRFPNCYEGGLEIEYIMCEKEE